MNSLSFRILNYRILSNFTAIELNQVAHVHSGRLLGGVEDEKPVDAEVRKVLASVDSELKSEHLVGASKIEALSYRTQVVAGKNYFVKVSMNDKDGKKALAHVRIYHHFSGSNKVSGIRKDVDETTPLKYFQ